MSGHRAPGWGVRNVKFNTGIGEKEVINFTEVRPLGILKSDARHGIVTYNALLMQQHSSTKRLSVFLRSSPIPRNLTKTDFDFNSSLVPTFTKPPRAILRVRTRLKTTMSGPLHRHPYPRAYPTYPCHTCIHIRMGTGTTIATRTTLLCSRAHRALTSNGAYRVRVRQICDVLLTNASSVSSSGSRVTSVTATTTAAHTPS